MPSIMFTRQFHTPTWYFLFMWNQFSLPKYSSWASNIQNLFKTITCIPGNAHTHLSDGNLPPCLGPVVYLRRGKKTLLSAKKGAARSCFLSTTPRRENVPYSIKDGLGGQGLKSCNPLCCLPWRIRSHRVKFWQPPGVELLPAQVQAKTVWTWLSEKSLRPPGLVDATAGKKHPLLEPGGPVLEAQKSKMAFHLVANRCT